MELIKVKEENGKQLVSARDLHEFFESAENFTVWAKRMLEYGFIENIDYEAVNIFIQAHNGVGGTNKTDYALTLETAKEISMLQRNEKGKQARQYFIECEKKAKSLDFSNPNVVLQLAQNWADAQNKLAIAETTISEKQQVIESQAPKVLFADAVATSERSVLISELAKILKQNGVEIGQNRLFDYLRNNGYLCKKGEYYNQPSQKAMDLSLFEIKKQSVLRPDGTTLVTATPKVTGKGQIYFVNKFLNSQIIPTAKAA